MNILTEYPIVVDVNNLPYTGSDSLSATIKVLRPTMLVGDTREVGRSIYAVNHPEMFNMTNSPVAGGTPLWIAASPDLGTVSYKIAGNEVLSNLTDLSNISTTPTSKITKKYYSKYMYFLEGTTLVGVDTTGSTYPADSTSTIWLKFLTGALDVNSGTLGGTVTSTSITSPANGQVYMGGSGGIVFPATTIGEGAFTVESWINSGSMFFGGTQTSDVARFFLFAENSTVPKLQFLGYNGAQWTYDYGASLCPASGWFHIAYVHYANGTFKWFINGVGAGSGTSVSAPLTLNSVGIGAISVWQGGCGGSLSQFKLTNGTAKYSVDFTPEYYLPSSYITSITPRTGVVTTGTINVSEDGTLIATTGASGVSVNNTSDLTSVGSAISTVSINSAISSDGTKVFVGSTADNLAGAYRISDGVQLLSLSKKQNPAYSSIIDRVAFATSVEDGAFTIVIYNATTLALVTTLTVLSLVKYLKFTYNGDELVAGFDSTTNPIKRYNTSDWSEITDRGDLTGITYNPSSVICMIP